MKNSEIRVLSADEIRQKLASEKEVLSKLRFAHAVSPIQSPVRIGETKKVIARLQTELKAKEPDK